MIEIDKIIFNSPIEVSGLDDDKPYIELTSRLCWCDYQNLNGVGISSKAIDSIQTLKDMPVVAKINSDGTRFGSHEVSIDDDGNIKFNTSAYGVHTDIWVAEDEVEIPDVGTKKLPCIFAKSKIWKRFSSVVELIANKFNEPDKYNGGLWSSWELQGSNYHIDENNGKIYDTFTFLSNCIIDVMPAYAKASKALNIASTESTFESDLEIAYINDIKIIEGGSNMSKTKTSALSLRDLWQKCSEVLNPKGWNSNPYYSIWNIYPEEHKVLAYDIDRETDDDYKVINYSVEGDVLSLGDMTDTKLSKILSEKSNVNIQVNLDETAKLLSQKEIKITELETTVSTLNSDVEVKTEALVKAGEEISTLKETVAELTPYKEKIQAIEQAENEKVIAEKKEILKKTALKGGYILESELETSEEIKTLIENLDEKSIKALIAERFIKKLEEDSANTNNTSNLETSAKEDSHVKTNLNSDDESAISVMNIFLGK